MKRGDVFAMGVKSLRERPLETGLIILGIALASCVAGSSVLLLGSQSAQTAKMLQGPAYREIVVRSGPDNGAASDSPVRDVSQNQDRPAQISDTDMQNVLQSINTVSYAYHYSVSTMRINGGRGQAAATFLINRQGTGSAATSGGAAGSGAAPATGSRTADAVPPTGGPDGGPGGPPELEALLGGNDQTTLAAGETLLTPAQDQFRAAEVSPSFFGAYGVNVAQGSLFTDDDAQKRATTLVLGPRIASLLFPDVKPADLIGKKTRLNGRIWTITGILAADSGDVAISNGTALSDLGFTPAAQTVIRNGGNTIVVGRFGSSIRFAVSDVKNLPAAALALKDYFDSTYGPDKVSLSVPFDEARLNSDGFNRLLWVIVAFGAGAFLMALINLMNMMITRSLRRQAPMAILSAMGAKRTDLASLQAVEGGFMALIGSVVGCVLAIPLYFLLYQAGKALFGIANATAPLDPLVLAVCAPVILILAVALAILPSWRSSRVSITNALRTE